MPASLGMKSKTYTDLVFGISSLLYIFGYVTEMPAHFFNVLVVASLFFALPLLKERLSFRWPILLAVSGFALIASAVICLGLQKSGITDAGIYGTGGWALFSILVLAPFREEAFYRFILWQPLECRLHISIVIVLTSFLFALAHLIPFSTLAASERSFALAQSGYTFVFGLVVATINAKTKSLTTVVSAHLFANLGAIIGFRLLAT